MIQRFQLKGWTGLLFWTRLQRSIKHSLFFSQFLQQWQCKGNDGSGSLAKWIRGDVGGRPVLWFGPYSILAVHEHPDICYFYQRCLHFLCKSKLCKNNKAQNWLKHKGILGTYLSLNFSLNFSTINCHDMCFSVTFSSFLKHRLNDNTVWIQRHLNVKRQPLNDAERERN